MLCFTVTNGTITEGVAVERVPLSGAGVTILAVRIGESGRGREQGILPVAEDAVSMLPCPGRPDHSDSIFRGGRGDESQHWPERPAPKCPHCGVTHEDRARGQSWTAGVPTEHPASGTVPGLLTECGIGTTRAGRPKLIRATGPDTERCLVAFHTTIGFRGSNAHTGDRTDTPCPRRRQQIPSYEYQCPDCKLAAPEGQTGQPQQAWVHPDDGAVKSFAPFPGQVLCRGSIAQGDAGRMGSGEQLVAVMPAKVVFRATRSGRLYGNTASHYYRFDGDTLAVATWEERVAADLWF